MLAQKFKTLQKTTALFLVLTFAFSSPGYSVRPFSTAHSEIRAELEQALLGRSEARGKVLPPSEEEIRRMFTEDRLSDLDRVLKKRYTAREMLDFLKRLDHMVNEGTIPFDGIKTLDSILTKNYEQILRKYPGKESEIKSAFEQLEKSLSPLIKQQPTLLDFGSERELLDFLFSGDKVVPDREEVEGEDYLRLHVDELQLYLAIVEDMEEWKSEVNKGHLDRVYIRIKGDWDQQGIAELASALGTLNAVSSTFFGYSLDETQIGYFASLLHSKKLGQIRTGVAFFSRYARPKEKRDSELLQRLKQIAIDEELPGDIRGYAYDALLLNAPHIEGQFFGEHLDVKSSSTFRLGTNTPKEDHPTAKVIAQRFPDVNFETLKWNGHFRFLSDILDPTYRKVIDEEVPLFMAMHAARLVEQITGKPQTLPQARKFVDGILDDLDPDSSVTKRTDPSFGGPAGERSEVRLDEENKMRLRRTLGEITKVLQEKRKSNYENGLAMRIASELGYSSLRGTVLDPAFLFDEENTEVRLVLALALREFSGDAPIAIPAADPRARALLQEINDWLFERGKEPFLLTESADRAVWVLQNKFKVRELYGIVGSKDSIAADEIRKLIPQSHTVTEIQVRHLMSLDSRLVELTDQLTTYYATAQAA